MSSTVEAGIDRDWLLRLYEHDPVAHAFARWDLDFAPQQCRFVTLRREGRPTAYLLVWHGSPSLPIVHWCGDPTPDPALLDAIPPRPFIAVVPESVAAEVAPRRGPTVASPLLILTRRAAPSRARPRREHTVRRLGFHDTAEIRRLAESMDNLTTTAYRTIDPEATVVFGAFLHGRLVGIARVQVALPEVWYVSGVFTAPSARNRGIGGDVTDAVAQAADPPPATAALVVREDNAPARRAYERIGFVPTGRRVHLLAAADAPG